MKKLLALNALGKPELPRIEVILLSRNSSDTGLRIFNSIERSELEIVRAAFTSGAPVWPYIKPFGAHLFLSANPESVRASLDNGVAAATILPARATARIDSQLRVADGDAVISADRTHLARGRAGSLCATGELAATPLSAGRSTASCMPCTDPDRLPAGRLAAAHRAGHRTLGAGAQTRDPHAAPLGRASG